MISNSQGLFCVRECVWLASDKRRLVLCHSANHRTDSLAAFAFGLVINRRPFGLARKGSRNAAPTVMVYFTAKNGKSESRAVSIKAAKVEDAALQYAGPSPKGRNRVLHGVRMGISSASRYLMKFVD